jgi:hypothetical protein
LRTVRVVPSGVPSTVCITITDNGRWQPVDTSRSYRGHGLRLMESSVDSFVVVRADSGTTVRLTSRLPALHKPR